MKEARFFSSSSWESELGRLLPLMTKFWASGLQ